MTATPRTCREIALDSPRALSASRSDAQTTTEEWSQKILQELKGKEDLLAKLKAENAAAAAAPKPAS